MGCLRMRGFISECMTTFMGKLIFSTMEDYGCSPIVVKKNQWIVNHQRTLTALTFGPLMSQNTSQQRTFLFQGREYVKVGFEAVYQRTDGEKFIYLCPNAAWLMNLPKQAGKVYMHFLG